jgi:TonB family protein
MRSAMQFIYPDFRKEIGWFLVLSIFFHLAILGMLYTTTFKEEIKKPQLLLPPPTSFARIITPEELSQQSNRAAEQQSSQNRAAERSSSFRQTIAPSPRRPVALSSDFRPPTSDLPSPTSPAPASPEKVIQLPGPIISRNSVKEDSPRLLDRDVIASTVTSATHMQQEPVKTKPPEITFDTREFKYQGYMARLKEKIESIWQYPRSAAERGIYGDLYIRFSIKKDGSLGRVDLVRTSGYRDLDEAAFKALRDASPFWPLPKEWDMEEFIIEGHFIYTLYGYYIR